MHDTYCRLSNIEETHMNAFLKKLMSTDAGFAPLALRIPIGITFMADTVWKALVNGWHPSALNRAF
jgi:hypothetical protein